MIAYLKLQDILGPDRIDEENSIVLLNKQEIKYFINTVFPLLTPLGGFINFILSHQKGRLLGA